MTKTDAVREFMREHRKARPDEAAVALKKKGIDITPQQFSSIRYQVKKLGRKSAKDRKPRRPFPQNSLEEALSIPIALRDHNGGKPWPPDDVAPACGSSKKASGFFYLSASARDYGLTTGTRESQEIALTDIGRDIVYPESAELEQQKKVEAFFNVPLFKQVYEHYDGGKLPEMQYLKSTLHKKFAIPEVFHDAFADLYRKNCEYLSLTVGMKVLSKQTETAGTVAVVGQYSGKYAHDAFVIMPFSEQGSTERPPGFFKEVIQSLVTPACNGADFAVTTADISGSDLIHHTIMKRLIEADLVIADLTDHNQNVAFELGVRIALNRPVALIRARGTGPFFDVDNLMRVWDYDPCLWKTSLEHDIPKLTDHVKAAWERRDGMASYMTILTGGQPNGN